MQQPLCPYFGTCGGCSSQDVAYTEQLARKKSFVLEELKKNNIAVTDVSVLSADPYGYRNRMDFAFVKEGVGLRKKGRWDDIIQIKHCPISNKKLNMLLAEVTAFAQQEAIDAFDVRTNIGTLKYAVIRTPEHGPSSISFILNTDSPRFEEQIALVKTFAANTTATNVVIGTVNAVTDMSVSDHIIVVKGASTLFETILGKTITYSSQAFFQNNTHMAETMVQHCKEILTHTSENTLLIDLYGGAGTFGICLANTFSETHIIDNVQSNINCAQKNIEANKLINARATCADAKILSTYIGKNATLIIDPPRAGLHKKVITAINALKPKTIIYISCNPAQMAKELPQLINHEAKSVAVFDLFPQTPHIETIAHLELRNS